MRNLGLNSGVLKVRDGSFFLSAAFDVLPIVQRHAFKGYGLDADQATGLACSEPGSRH